MASYTPEQLAAIYAQRASEVPGAAKRGFRNALVAVDREAVKNLSGTGGAGSYPVPIRSRLERRQGGGTVNINGGNLRRGQGMRQTGEAQGYVFNRAMYANAVHTLGFNAYGNPNAPRYAPRPWLDNAVAAVDVLDVSTRPIRKVLGL